MTTPRMDETEPMNENSTFEARLGHIATQMAYPPTPDLRGRVRARLLTNTAPRSLLRLNLAQIALLVLIVLSGLLAVPQVRAEIIRIMRLGGITVIIGPTSTPTATTPPYMTDRTWTPNPTSTPQPQPIGSVSDLVGETTLDEARTSMLFPVLLPSYPPELGESDRVFVQDLMGGKVVVLVWLDPTDTSEARLVLHILGPGAEAMKGADVIQETTVNGGLALWVGGTHMLLYRNGLGQDIEFRVLVPGNVLIWKDNRVTYRLESGLPLDEAIRIAESVK